ncbi:MAG TPA: MOSC domain-containing protein, partial [Anaerolineales bacterium]|nr:MOSC domain-containing protein [Anaerolineales bacterium]
EVDGREILQSADLNLTEGLVGDNWKTRGSTATPDGSAHPEAQINIMNSRAVALLAQEKDRWALAGDQFFIDLDLGVENLPAGTRLALGSAILEVTAKPHTGCDKFAARYGRAAALFVNSTEGKKLHLRGINAKVVQAGTVRVGDAVKKI